MKSIVFFDGPEFDSLLPVTYLKPCALSPIGTGTILSRWQKLLDFPSYGFLTRDYLKELYSYESSSNEKIYINGACLPNKELVKNIASLPTDSALISGSDIICITSKSNFENYSALLNYKAQLQTYDSEVQIIRYPEHLLDHSETMLITD